MRQLLALAALAAAFVAGCAPARAQNATCPDVPAGDSSNRCANTRFVGAAGYVKGPVSSTVGDVPVFNNTTGTLVADSGVPVSTLSTVYVYLQAAAGGL